MEALPESLRSHSEIIRVLSSRGEPGRRVIEEAEAWGADVVVLGTDTRGGLHRLLFGSVDQQVVRHARCAVLVRPGCERGESPARLVAADARGG